MQRNQVVDTYEAVWLGVEENDIETLKGLPEFERVGGYYMLGEELSEQGYHASYVYCDAQMMEITKAQMKLLEGRVPEKANEVVVSEYFLSTYGNNAKIGDTVTLDTESFHGDYVVTGIMDSVNEKEANTCAIILSKAALTEWDGFDPAGYRAYAHFKNSDQLDEELMTSYCREIAEEYQLPMPKMNSKYFAYASKSFDFALMAGVIAIVLIGGYIVIQSIFRISINDKIKSYGQLRTIGATPKQIKRIVKREGRKLGSIGILIGTVLGLSLIHIWVAIGLALSMSGITIALFFVTKQTAVLLTGGVLLLCALVGIFVLTQAFGKRLSQFTADLCQTLDPVSYTHLDVYKRQALPRWSRCPPKPLTPARALPRTATL